MNTAETSPEPSQNLILDLTFQFSLNLLPTIEILERSKKFVIANQLIRSGTSIGANVREAQNPESNNDFIHKMKIAAKEADETEYWLEICQHSAGYPNCEDLLAEITSIRRVLSKIIISAHRNR